MGRQILRITAAATGILLAIVVFMNFEIFEIKTTAMMPVLEPGMCVLVQRCDASEVELGDLVLYEAAAYDFDTQDGLMAIRMVSGEKDGKFRLSCSEEAVYGREIAVDGEKIWGKVILWERKNAS